MMLEATQALHVLFALLVLTGFWAGYLCRVVTAWLVERFDRDADLADAKAFDEYVSAARRGGGL